MIEKKLNISEIDSFDESLLYFEDIEKNKLKDMELSELDLNNLVKLLKLKKDNLSYDFNEDLIQEVRDIYYLLTLIKSVLKEDNTNYIISKLNLDISNYEVINAINLKKFIGDLIPNILNEDFLSTVFIHKEIKKSENIKSLDIFINKFKSVSKAAKTEILAKIENLKDSNWLRFILIDGGDKNNRIHQNLINIYKKIKLDENNESLQIEFSNSIEDLYKELSLNIIVSDELGGTNGYQIAKMDKTKSLGLIKMSGKGQVDSAIMGCPFYKSSKDFLFLSSATANDDKSSQNRQWVKILEGIMLSIKLKISGFENVKGVSSAVVSLASLNDNETLKSKNKILNDKEISSLRKLNEFAELFKSTVEYNYRFKDYCSMIMIKFIGSKEIVDLKNKSIKEIQDLVLDNTLLSINAINEGLQKDKDSFFDLDSTKKNQYIKSIMVIVNSAKSYMKPDDKLINFIKNANNFFNDLTEFGGLDEYRELNQQLTSYLENPENFYNLNLKNNPQNIYKQVKYIKLLDHLLNNDLLISKNNEIDLIYENINKEIKKYILDTISNLYTLNDNDKNKLNNIIEKEYNSPHYSNEEISEFFGIDPKTFNMYKSNFHTGNESKVPYGIKEVFYAMNMLPKLNGVTHLSDRCLLNSNQESKLKVSLKNALSKAKRDLKDTKLFMIINLIEVSIKEISDCRFKDKEIFDKKIKQEVSNTLKQNENLNLNDRGISNNMLNIINEFKSKKNKIHKKNKI